MQRAEFLKLIGDKSENNEYTPVACLLRNGYACAGYVNHTVSEQYSDLCIMLNARMVDLREPTRRTERGAVHDFSDFLEEFVLETMKKRTLDPDLEDDERDPFQDRFGKSIPLTAIAFNEIAVVYPVKPIGDLLKRISVETKATSQEIPTFLDFEKKSLVVKVLRTKLW